MDIQKAIERMKKHKEWGFVNDTADAIDLSIQALEKQIPTKPITKQLGEDIEVTCPNCGYCQIIMDSKKGHNYCQNCGTKFDWSGKDEKH